MDRPPEVLSLSLSRNLCRDRVESTHDYKILVNIDASMTPDFGGFSLWRQIKSLQLTLSFSVVP
jgi:hypothetical protein